jgi:putative ABC transport system permease protein
MRRTIEALLQDLRHGARLLGRNPGFAAVVLATLALGIGGVSAIMSLVDAVLVRPLPFQDPKQLAILWENNRPRQRERNVVGPYNYVRWRERNRSFEDLAAFSRFEVNVAGKGEPERLMAGVATGNLFTVLGVAPLLGRPLVEADSQPGAAEVIVLAEGYWKRRYGADPSAVGETLEVNGRPRQIVGVLPGTVQIPPGAEFWIPLVVDEQFRNAGGRWMVGVGRLDRDVTWQQARDEMTRLAVDLEKENPAFDTGWGVNVQPMHADMVREVRPALVVLFVAVGLVLLIACANVANLLLARALVREREIALRSALGAGTGRLVRQLLTEAALAGLAGGALGLLLGRWALRGIVALLPPEIPLLVDVSLNPRVLLLTFVVAVGSALLFGLAPALQLVRPSLVQALRQGGTVRGASRARLRLKNALVVAETALAIVLLTGAGLLMRSFWRLSGVAPGFEPRGVLTAQVSLPYEEPARIVKFYEQAVDRLGRLPGVKAAGAISWLPFSPGSATDFRLLDRPAPPPGQEPVGDVRMVTPGLLRAMGIPLLQGRDFRDSDGEGAPDVVIVNQALVREYWPGQDPIGKRIFMEWNRNHDAEVVGVVGDVRLRTLDAPARATLYWSQAQIANSFMTLMVRGDAAPATLAPALRAVVAELDPKLPVSRVAPLSEVVETSLSSQRFLLVLTAAFASLALLLTGIGIYGVISYAVARRTPEIGVRLALGARGSDVARRIVGDTLRTSAIGVALGLAGAAATGRLLEGLLFGISAWDPYSYLSVALGALAVSAAVAAVPALRAASIDPAVALREE